jgi:PAS domain S-box-containing protein
VKAVVDLSARSLPHPHALREVAAEASPTGILVLDDVGTILYANPRAAAIFGHMPSDLLGYPVDAILPAAARDESSGQLHRFWTSPETRRAGIARDIRGSRKGGATIFLDLGWTPALSEGSRMVVVSVTDAAERRLLEQRARDHASGSSEFERLVADLAARFVSLGPAQLDGAIVDAQRRVGETLDIDRCVLWQLTERDENLVDTHTWIRPGLPAAPTALSARELFPYLFSKVIANETVWHDSVDDVPAEPDRGNLRRFHMKSHAVVPMEVSGRVVGALSFGSLRKERSWTPDVLDRLRLLAAVLAQVLARRRSQIDLEYALAEVERLKDQLASENVQLRHEVTALKGPRTVVAESESIQRALAQADLVAGTDSTVLLTGETGCGKVVFAQAIHDASRRGGRPMVRVNCAAIPTALMESELFGRERGAYTGALSRQIGRFELASGTTIFLDEVGDLPLEAQVKLLRILQDRTLERLGGTRPIHVDVRVIAATNRDLQRAVAERTFREDLFYRLNVFPISIPPLRERAPDIPVLVWTFVDEFSKAFNKTIHSISKESLAALKRHAWPGNVRELRNVIERAVIVAQGPVLTIEPFRTDSGAAPARLNLVEVEREHIRDVLDRTRWRVRGVAGAAEILGMKPTTLESRMAKLGILRPKP